MEDMQIIDLFWARDESAISASSEKYGAYCHSIALRILRAEEDAQECVNDTWLSAWKAMPPHRPTILRTFLGRLTRNLAVNVQLAGRARKRGGGEIPLVLEELGECVRSGENTEETFAMEELSRILDRFLRTLPEEECSLFLRRYWYMDSVRVLAQRFRLSDNAVKSRLFRTRQRLKEYLAKEGYAI